MLQWGCLEERDRYEENITLSKQNRKVVQDAQDAQGLTQPCPREMESFLFFSQYSGIHLKPKSNLTLEIWIFVNFFSNCFVTEHSENVYIFFYPKH